MAKPKKSKSEKSSRPKRSGDAPPKRKADTQSVKPKRAPKKAAGAPRAEGGRPERRKFDAPPKKEVTKEAFAERSPSKPEAERTPRPKREKEAAFEPKSSVPARGTKVKRDRADEPSAPKPTPTIQAAEPVAFTDLGLIEPVARAISEMGFETATPIQAQAIPVLLEGGDLIGLAQTGTGKTAAFAIPIIQKIDPSLRETQSLVLAPTRELAVQVAGGIHDLAKHTGIRVVPVYGGQPIDRQFRALNQGAHVVVGTPGRVLDHLRRGSLALGDVRICVLDEADEMMALGFTEDMEAILAELPDTRQLAFFSATMAPRVRNLTEKFLRQPRQISIEATQRTVETTNQTYYEVPKGKKLEALARVLDMETPGSTIVFCRTRQDTNDLTEALRLRGYSAEPLHGDMNQTERDRVMRRFREGQADLLIATDVAARGLDVDSVTHVINYDIPWDVEQYIHRIGRTGRAGRSGDAITLVTGKERRQLQFIERMIGAPIKPARIPTAADISARRRELFAESLRETLETRNFDGQMSIVEEFCEEYDPAEVAAAALQMLWQERHDGADVAEELAFDFEQPEQGMVRLFVGMGRQQGLRPGDLVGAITNEAGLIGKAIGVIDILDRTSFVEVPAGDAPRVVDALRNAKIRNLRVKVEIALPPEELATKRRR